MSRIFYCPSHGVSADFIPFFENGVFYLFYLQDDRDVDRYGEGTPWFLIATKDFIRFEEYGEVLPRGTQEEQDLYVYTGSVTKIGTRYHIYYTGHNPHLRSKGLPEQAVMHAVGDDLRHWVKQPQDTFFAPRGYGIHDWRDPFVFYEPEQRRWRMLLAARTERGPDRRRGITAQCFSADGSTWEVGSPLYMPEIYYTHECPDVFRMGEWYYLLFSEFSQEHVTRYRMSRNIDGPWLTPTDDRLDACAFYAAKTTECEDGRYLFGWIATRTGDTDDGRWQWGGCLAVHRLIQQQNGALDVQMPRSVADAFCPAEEYTAQLQDRSRLCTASFGKMDDCCMLTCDFRIPEASGRVTLALSSDEGLSQGYFVVIDLDRARMYLDRWPRIVENGLEPGLERPIALTADGRYTLRVLVDGTAACAYLNDVIALSFRMYDRSKPFWGILAENAIVFSDCQLHLPT